MEGDTLSADELRDAGASEAYIQYYTTAIANGYNTSSTAHAERVVTDGVNSGGGFHDSLWNDEPRYPNNSRNPYGADATNKRILEEAGVYESADDSAPMVA